MMYAVLMKSAAQPLRIAAQALSSRSGMWQVEVQIWQSPRRQCGLPLLGIASKLGMTKGQVDRGLPEH